MVKNKTVENKFLLSRNELKNMIYVFLFVKRTRTKMKLYLTAKQCYFLVFWMGLFIIACYLITS